jgi:ABC-type antimicrobial peptide transport system permease subunit
MALGARTAEVVRMLIAQGMMPVLVGIGIGLVGAYATSRVLASLLFAVSATDPITYGSVAVILGLAALAAICGPTFRVTRVDPSVSLRAE